MTTHSADATTPALEVPTLARRHGVAVSVVTLALLMTLAIPSVRNESPTALFFAAIMVSSWYGGLGAGLFATALATGVIDSFIMPPVYAVVLGLGEIVRIGVFVLVALLISALNASRQRLGEALHQRAIQLAEADRRKDEFLATLAHELRNPLAAIGGALEALRLGRGDSAEAMKTWGIIDRQAHQMARLTDDLLDASRITRGAITLRKEEVDLGTMITRAVETVRTLIDERRHELSVALPPEPVRLEADSLRLEQVLVNLLHNAAKYTEPGGRIWLVAERSGDEIALRVRDTGIGIAPEMLPRVFDSFVQAGHVRTRIQEGLGIGLSLVRSLVVMHGGRIQAQSAGVGCGSEFIVHLPAPLEGASEGRGREPVAREATGPPRRVLIVEDWAAIAQSLAKVLEWWGCEVRTARDGEEALNIARDYRPEVVLLDIGLPGMGGDEVARCLRRQAGPYRPRLVALTGHVPEGDPRSSGTDFDDYLLKPVDLDALRRSLASPDRLAHRRSGDLSVHTIAGVSPSMSLSDLSASEVGEPEDPVRVEQGRACSASLLRSPVHSSSAAPDPFPAARPIFSSPGRC
jgi:signal transduction histidine kinase/ActR/RegA family two-component response regulator